MAHIQPSSPALSATQRTTSRQQLSMPARLTWKDQGGAVRFASVMTRDVSETGAFVECGSIAPIPLFRLVHLQLETPGAAATAGVAATPLAAGRVLAAVWRVERDSTSAGSPAGYALRFMIDPAQAAAAPRYAMPDMAVAS